MAKEGLGDIEQHFVKYTQGKPENYLSGTTQPMMVDLHAFPLLERFAMLLDSPLKGAFVHLDMKENCPTVYRYLYMIRENPLFAKHVMTQRAYSTKLSMDLEAGQKLPYDIR